MRIVFFDLLARIAKCNSTLDFALLTEDLDSIKESLTTEDYCEIAKQVSRFGSIASAALLFCASTEYLGMGLTLHLREHISALIAYSIDLNKLSLPADMQYARGERFMCDEATLVAVLDDDLLCASKDFALKKMNSIRGLERSLSWEDVIGLREQIHFALNKLPLSPVSKTAGT